MQSRNEIERRSASFVCARKTTSGLEVRCAIIIPSDVSTCRLDNADADAAAAAAAARLPHIVPRLLTSADVTEMMMMMLMKEADGERAED